MDTKVLRSLVEVREWFQKNESNKWAVDTETTSLNYYDLEMVGMSLCNGNAACYINLFENSEFDKIVLYLRWFFGEEVDKAIFHNAAFDMKVLYKYMIPVPEKIFCTMTAHYLLDENNAHNLKYLAKKILNVPESSIEAWEDAASKGFGSEEFESYGLRDSIWCWELHNIFHPQLFQQKLDKLFFEVEMPFQFVLRDLAIHGIKVDRRKAKELQTELNEKISDLEYQMIESLGMKRKKEKTLFPDLDYYIMPINFASSKQVAEAIENLGIHLPYTEQGNPSTSSEVLEDIKDQHEFIRLLLEYRKAQKMYTSFVLPLFEKIDKDGRVRCDFNSCVTKTGRLSCSNPNMQQLPSNAKKPIVDFRQVFIADDGKVLIGADYAGQELRVLGKESNDPNLTKAFNRGLDLHLATGNKIFKLGLSEDEMLESHEDYDATKATYKYERHVGKNGVNFPLIYGKTEYGIAKTFGISTEEAKIWIESFWQLYPKAKERKLACDKFLKYNHYVYSMSGRRRRFPNMDNLPKAKYRKAFRQAFNFLIQGYSADMIKMAMNKCREIAVKNKEWGLKLILTVHDEIVFEVNEKYAEIAAKAVKKAMETVVKFPFPIIADVSIGVNYSECK